MKSVHPFPARMAPSVALESLMALNPGSIVLDPMAGSGTVLRQAAELGHNAIGYDLDPLAVLMARVWTTPVNDATVDLMYQELKAVAHGTTDCWPALNFDAETADFIRYWFGPSQIQSLSRLALAIKVLSKRYRAEKKRAAIDILKLNLSKIIVTKEQVASLARDTSHSRPHKVADKSTYNVFEGYERSLRTMRERLIAFPPKGHVTATRGDARSLSDVCPNSIDAVITSPPYLNAIDYLRGHRMSLVWLGWSIAQLRSIRSNSIGAERGPNHEEGNEAIEPIISAMLGKGILPPRRLRMVQRYAGDLYDMIAEIARVLKTGGIATFVVGNSCLKGVFIKNAEGIACAANMFGMKETGRFERQLPAANRYLPVTGDALGKRMRTETVLTFDAA